MGSLKYREITSPDINNGLGCRVTIWISGCGRKCPHCHNQELWKYGCGNDIWDAKDRIREELSKPYISGLTLSGGDPLDQSPDALVELYDFICWVKEEFPNKNIWIYSGDYFANLVKDKEFILRKCDVLVDGPYIHELRDITLPFRGSDNQSIIDLVKTFSSGEVTELKIE